MRSAAFAEWVLARYTDKVRAAAIIGDLLEDRQGTGRIEFWRAFCAILCSFVWRRALAFAVAVVFGLCSFDFLHNLLYGVYGSHLPTNLWRILPEFACLASILLSFGMVYTAVRFGVRDVFAQQVIVAWGLTSVVGAYWWMPGVPTIAAMAGVGCLWFWLRSAPGRRALLAFGVTFGVAIGIYGLALFVMQNLAASHVPAFKSLAFYEFAVGLVIQPMVYSRVRDMLWRDKLRVGAAPHP